MAQVNDELGDRIKSYESLSTRRQAFKGQPIIVRLDGKAFHTFTKGVKKPYDDGLSSMMIETMKYLVDAFQANLGYCQSDEITLLFYIDRDSKAEYIYGGRFQKLESLLAASTSVYFNKLIPGYLPSKITESPVFDARAFVVPTLEDAYDCFLWRQLDATKNAVSMAAHAYFTHKELHGKHSNEMQEMLFANFGINFNDYPYFFKRGTFAYRERKEITLTDEQLINIPEKFREQAKTCIRSVVTATDIYLPKRPEQHDYDMFKTLVKGI